MQDLMELADEHHAFERTFLRHQELILSRRWCEALELLRRFRRRLEIHMLEEEEILLPVYEARMGCPLGGSPEQFRLEHGKIRHFVNAFVNLEHTLAWSSCSSAHDVIALIEEQSSFKRLMLRHDQRERGFLYRGLDAQTCVGEKLDMIQRIEEMRLQYA